MDRVFLCKLTDGLHPSQRLQTHLDLELRQVDVALFRFTRLVYPFLSTVSHLNTCSKFRVHFTKLPAVADEFKHVCRRDTIGLLRLFKVSNIKAAFRDLAADAGKVLKMLRL